MNHLEKMRKDRDAPSVALSNFYKARPHYPGYLFCFFEGEKDEDYYGVRIKSYIGNYRGFSCGGKKNVIYIHDKLEEHTEKEIRTTSKAFFIDKDFDDLDESLLKKGIYQTPRYSIENFYTCEESFKEILEKEFKIKQYNTQDKKKEEAFGKCLQLFRDTQKKFHQLALIVNGCFYYIYKYSEQRRTKKSFKDINLESKIRISIEKVEENDSIKEYLKQSFSDLSLSDENIEQGMECFKNSCYQESFRGKEELDFLLKFLNILKNDLCSSTPEHFDEKIKISCQLPNSKNILSYYTQYAYTPPCLKTYLKKISTNISDTF